MTGTTATGPKPNGNGRKERLLIVVDGEASQLYYTGILLQRLAYTIYTAKTAEEALEIMSITVPSLILTELSLPKMSGMEFLRQVKRQPGTKTVPVIVYTSQMDTTQRDACQGEGCAAFLTKPIDPDTLYAAIQKVTEPTPRNFVRLAIRLKVIVGEETTRTPSPDESITALSESGMYISTSHPRKVGTRLPMTILLNNAGIRVEGNVLYSFEPGAGPLRTPGMGIKFERIQPEDLDLIRTFIKEQLTQNIVRK